MCGVNGMGTTAATPTKGGVPLPDVAPPKGGGSTSTAGANGGPTSAPTALGGAIEQITQIEKTLEALIQKLQAGGGPAGGPPADPAPGKGPGQFPGQVGGMAGCPMMGGLPSPVQQFGPPVPVALPSTRPGGPTTGAVQGLQSFVKQGQETLVLMQQRADENARSNGGKYSQVDLVTIQQRKGELAAANDLVAFMQLHPKGVDAQVKDMSNQALTNANVSGGNFSNADIAAIKQAVLRKEAAAG